MAKLLGCVALFVCVLVIFPTANHFAAVAVDAAAVFLSKNVGANILYVFVGMLVILACACLRAEFKR